MHKGERIRRELQSVGPELGGEYAVLALSMWKLRDKTRLNHYLEERAIIIRRDCDG